MPEPTTTNYALLGLLALRKWSAYELVGQSQRALGFLWPRAESKVYESAKRLVSLGLARAEHEHTGSRRRTVYSITPAGRRALKAWLHRPGRGPDLEFEGAIKLFFADLGTREDALATVEEISRWAADMATFGAALADEYLETDGGPFPGRLHVNALVNELLWRHVQLVGEWAGWAREQIEEWRGSGPQPQRHDEDLATYRRSARAAPTSSTVASSPAS
jgi:PadR family transcriptional regulator AphA